MSWIINFVKLTIHTYLCLWWFDRFWLFMLLLPQISDKKSDKNSPVWLQNSPVNLNRQSCLNFAATFRKFRKNSVKSSKPITCSWHQKSNSPILQLSLLKALFNGVLVLIYNYLKIFQAWLFFYFRIRVLMSQTGHKFPN